MLNRYPDSKNISQAKHILKYIFPKQFGLHNVFTHTTDRRETTHAFKDYTDREGEIILASKSRDEKVFKRLGKGVLPLIGKMQKLHQRCSYNALIHYYCSAAADEEIGKGKGEIVFDEEMETSKVLTQRDVSTVSTRMSDGDIQVTSSKDVDIIRHHTPHHQVHITSCLD